MARLNRSRVTHDRQAVKVGRVTLTLLRYGGHVPGTSGRDLRSRRAGTERTVSPATVSQLNVPLRMRWPPNDLSTVPMAHGRMN
jgi:hypothetical protein